MLEIVRKKIEQVKHDADAVLDEMSNSPSTLFDALGRSMACQRLLDEYPLPLCRDVFRAQYANRSAIRNGALAIFDQFDGLV